MAKQNEDYSAIIKSRHHDRSAAALKGSVEDSAAFFHPLAVIVKNEQLVAFGEKGIHEYFTKMFANGAMSAVQFTSTSTYGVQDVIIDDGRWKSTLNGQTNTGTYKQIWKKHGDIYCIYHDEYRQD